MESEYIRPDPDTLLARLKEDDSQSTLGKLKIFLGYAAGVGKTYAMLEAAHQRKCEGIDVVVAYIETHHRKETDDLLEGLEVLPRTNILYRGMDLLEMNLDGIIARKPQLVLVDELAHTNAPGSRHPKRYQDVKELLDEGIDVYTTVNIQHLESMNDVIFQITGVHVRETVPDKVIDEAYEIELIDLPPDELLQRLKDGKVYIPDQVSRAIEKFFRKGNLTALREMSLRRAAERVDNQMRSYMESKSIPGPWPAQDRILVSLSSHPLGERLIRAGRRLADEINAEWFVLFVETPGHLHMPVVNKERMENNLKLAEELGAQVFRMTGQSVAEEIVQFCKTHNVTKIIAGKPIRPRWREIFQQSVIDEIIRKSGRVDVYVISDHDESLIKFPPELWVAHSSLGRYIASIGLVILATVIGQAIHSFFEPTNLVMIYLAIVVIAAVFLGRGPSMVASLLSVLAFDFFLVNPRLSFAVSDTQYLVTFFGLLLVGLIISNSASLLKEQVDALRKRDGQTQALNQFSRELTGAINLEQVLRIVVSNISKLFDRPVVVLLPEGERLKQKAASENFQLTDAEFALAEWSYKNGSPAGRGTNTLPVATLHVSPLITIRGTIGILGLKPNSVDDHLSPDQLILLSGFTNLTALAVEREKLAAESVQTETLRSAERLQTALLNSISHQFRTPLATITGVLTSLGDSEHNSRNENKLDHQTKMELIETATEQAGQLNRLVENLLNMTRLESGAVHIHSEISDLHELFGAVIEQMKPTLQKYLLDMEISPDLPNVFMDPVLTGQVLVNLLENACKYSPQHSKITISAKVVGEYVEVAVKDEGIGIPNDVLEKVFDKFYRVESAHKYSGTGLGLSICKGIVEAQGGRIWIVNNPQKGITVIFSIHIQMGSLGFENK